MFSPASGIISTEQDTISVQVNPGGLSTGTYSGFFNITITDKNDKIQTATIPVTLSFPLAARRQPPAYS